jgi:hypothetical protein
LVIKNALFNKSVDERTTILSAGYGARTEGKAAEQHKRFKGVFNHGFGWLLVK